MTDSGCEVRFEVDGRALTGLRYRAPDGGATIPPVLALHGWLDNAASFAGLLPALALPDAIALDLPGHGLSDHRPRPGTYNIWDDLLDILAVADCAGFERFILIGHSRGAIIALLLAACEPRRIAGLVLLDGAVPEPVAPADAPAQLRHFLADQRRPGRRPPLYPSIDDAVAARCRAMPMSAAAARLVVERGLVADGEHGYRWRSDPRLMSASAFKLSEAHNRAFVDALRCPTLALFAEQGLGALPQPLQWLQQSGRVQVSILPGGHHFHLDAANTPAVARAAGTFIRDLDTDCTGEES